VEPYIETGVVMNKSSRAFQLLLSRGVLPLMPRVTEPPFVKHVAVIVLHIRKDVQIV
jgi:hypothetical protein